MKKKVHEIDINPDLFEKYFEIPQGVHAYQTSFHQKIRVGLKVLEAKPGNFIVKMRDAIFVISPYQFKQRFLKVPDKAVSAHIGFMDKDDNVCITCQSRIDNGNAEEHSGGGNGNGAGGSPGENDAGQDGVSPKLPEQPE